MKEKYSHDALKKKLEELPVPDDEQSWQKMKALLDKDEKKDRVLLPFFLNCAGWALLFLLTAGSIWFFWPSGKDNSVSKIDAERKKADPADTKRIEIDETPETPQRNTSSDGETPYDIEKNDQVLSVPVKNKNNEASKNTKNKNPVIKPNNRQVYKRIAPNSLVVSSPKRAEEKKSQPPSNSSISEALTQSIQNTLPKNNIVVTKHSVDNPFKDALTQSIPDSILENTIAIKGDSNETKDSAVSKTTDGDSLVTEKDSVARNRKTKNLHFAAGLSLQQQVPINDQSLNAYTINGRTNSLTDYLPAIYLRLQKENKWFVQAGFRYSAPQATKELTYRSTTTRDNVRRTTTTATLRLRKTFYHQVPFSFNYVLLPNFSFGAGGMYSHFETAVSELELKVRNNQTNAETVTRDIMKTSSNTDAVFTASQWHYLFQGEYSWKKWGVGLRYTGGLQPFIRYVEMGLMKEEKNQSLQVFLRYDFLKRKL